MPAMRSIARTTPSRWRRSSSCRASVARLSSASESVRIAPARYRVPRRGGPRASDLVAACRHATRTGGRRSEMAPVPFQVAIDCSNPHAQARFWAEALGYDVEDHEPGIRELIDAGVATDEDVVDVGGRLAWRTAAAIRHPDDPALGTPDARIAR